MLELKGERISQGIAFGKLVFYKKETCFVEKSQILDADIEIERLNGAIAEAVGELQVLYEKSVKFVGQENALIFGMHQMLLEDIEFVEEITQMIKNQMVNAEYAVSVVSKKYEVQLEKQKRAEDMRDVAERLLRVLQEKGDFSLLKQEGVLLVADELLPSETVQLDSKRILGIVLRKGASNSHTAIFAKNMGIPTIINVGENLVETYNGTYGALNATEGVLYVKPSETVVNKLQQRQQAEYENLLKLKAYEAERTVVAICANVGSLEDVNQAIEYGADGIGLVRSEVLCLREKRILTEEEQTQIYKEIGMRMAGKRVVIRTWDFGEDKELNHLPSMNLRGILWCLENQEIFCAQIRAIYRASVYGKLAMMFPMISSIEEVKQVKQVLKQVRSELEKNGVPFDRELEIGVMLETPASISISSELAKEVDFFSIGTNDLIQYTFALDRQHSLGQSFYETYYPTLSKMIRMAIKNVHAAGKRIGICGELGSELKLTEEFVEMGIDELSMSPSSILPVRKRVKEIE